MRKKFDLKNERDIADLKIDLKDISIKHPFVIDFLEEICGFYTPILSTEANDHLYAGAKREVILTIKTILRDDISPKQIAEYYKANVRSKQL